MVHERLEVLSLTRLNGEVGRVSSLSQCPVILGKHAGCWAGIGADDRRGWGRSRPSLVLLSRTRSSLNLIPECPAASRTPPCGCLMHISNTTHQYGSYTFPTVQAKPKEESITFLFLSHSVIQSISKARGPYFKKVPESNHLLPSPLLPPLPTSNPPVLCLGSQCGRSC